MFVCGKKGSIARVFINVMHTTECKKKNVRQLLALTMGRMSSMATLKQMSAVEVAVSHATGAAQAVLPSAAASAALNKPDADLELTGMDTNEAIAFESEYPESAVVVTGADDIITA